MEKENYVGQIQVLMMVFLKKTICMVKAFIDGMMEENSRELMLTISWKDMEFLHGKTVESMLVDIKMIKNVDMVLLNGQMVESTLVLGRTASSMVMEFISLNQEKRKGVHGKMEKE